MGPNTTEDKIINKNLVSTSDNLMGSRLKLMFEVLPSGIVLLDPAGRVLECNQAARSLLGGEIIGLSWLEIILHNFAPKKDDGCEVSLRDGRRLNIATCSLPNDPGQLIVLTDLTHTRALQDALSRQTRLSELGKMLAELAHQIRTPLSTALIYSSYLQKKNITAEKHDEFVIKLIGRLKHIEQQIEDMLLYAKGEKALTQIIYVSELIEELKQETEVMILQSNAEFNIFNETEDNLKICCQKQALLGAIQNLVNNALQACKRRPEINIFFKKTNDSLKIIVRDNGVGMSEEIKNQVLQPFFTTKLHGTGLGLAIVQAVIKAHSGTIEIDSKEGQGTSIELILPIMH